MTFLRIFGLGTWLRILRLLSLIRIRLPILAFLLRRFGLGALLFVWLRFRSFLALVTFAFLRIRLVRLLAFVLLVGLFALGRLLVGFLLVALLVVLLLVVAFLLVALLVVGLVLALFFALVVRFLVVRVLVAVLLLLFLLLLLQFFDALLLLIDLAQCALGVAQQFWRRVGTHAANKMSLRGGGLPQRSLQQA